MQRSVRAPRCSVLSGALIAMVLAAEPLNAGETEGVVSVLDTHYRWATHITMLTPVMRNADGTLAPLPPDAFDRYEKVVDLRSDPPPAEWAQPDFDDGAWPRAPGPYPLLAGYAFGSVGHAHHFGLFCMRGKFLVEDPSRAAGLKLSLTYRGGAVVYLNGKEIARGHMPEGKTAFDTPALDYPQETYVDSQGGLVPADFDCKRNKEHTERAELRTRRLENVAIPADSLRKGVNVLAVALHRAPLSHAYAPRARGRVGLWVQIGFFGLSLTAPRGAPVTPGGSAPTERRVFNALAPVSLHNLDRFDAWEPLRPMTLIACRNAGASGQVVLYGPKPIKGVVASVSDLESTSSRPARIPAAAAEIRYALTDLAPDGQEAERFATERGALKELRRFLRRFDALEEEAPAEAPLSPTGDTSLLPVWLTVNVPRDAAPGKYAAVLKLMAEDMKPVNVPVELEVPNVVLPDRDRGATYAGIVQSPETLTLKYGAKHWSEEHWRLMERSFRQIGRLGGDFVAIPLVRRTFYGNEESMVRWVRGKDGTLRHDLKVFERYLDCAIAESGPPRIVCLCIWEPINAYSDPGPEGRGMKMEVTVVSADGGAVESAPAPDWGAAECRSFWKPVFDDIRKALAARKLEAAMCVGNAAQAPPGQVVIDDLEQISPGIKWFALRHEWWDKIGPRETAVSVGVYGTPGRSGPGKMFAYAWQDPRLWAVWPRTSTCSVRETSTPLFYRVFMDRVMLAGASGIGNIGGDFWEVLRSADGRLRSVVRGNWVQLTMGGWGTPARIIAPGAKGPVGTARLEMLREGIQDAEVRILVEKALVNEAKRTKLGPAWEQRARDMLERYTRVILLAHPGGGKGFGGTFHDSFTWYAQVLPAERKALYDVAAALDETK